MTAGIKVHPRRLIEELSCVEYTMAVTQSVEETRAFIDANRVAILLAQVSLERKRALVLELGG